jgi:hypothetical protein
MNATGTLNDDKVGVFLRRRCTGDGGRPSALALQEESANHRKVRRSRAVRAERCGKRRANEHVRYDPMKTSEREPPLMCRKLVDGIETRPIGGTWDEPGMAPVYCPGGVRHEGGVSTGQAPVRNMGTCRLAGGRFMVTDLRLPNIPGKAPSGRIRKEPKPHARHRGGPPGSSDEGPVTGLERSGRAIQATLTVNHAVCGRTR